MKTKEYWGGEIGEGHGSASFEQIADEIQTDARAELLAVIEKCEKALEYCGCHEHSESPCDESGSHYKSLCTFCNTVDEALAAIRAVKGEKK